MTGIERRIAALEEQASHTGRRPWRTREEFQAFLHSVSDEELQAFGVYLQGVVAKAMDEQGWNAQLRNPETEETIRQMTDEELWAQMYSAFMNFRRTRANGTR